MKICTITCHDVYNHGASLQAYGLMTYLSNCGHDVEIIDYKPEYLSNYYNLLNINNPKWNKNILAKSIYLILKVPTRIVGLKRKKAFDRFTAKFLKITKSRYTSMDELKKNTPNADAYFCGSDQIWNTSHKNGKDPAFYLEFVPDEKIKASYAASFATDTIADEYISMVKQRVERLDAVSVREKSGVKLLKKLEINKESVNVVDPVFLLDKEDWDHMDTREFKEKYILVYDFDSSELIKKIALEIAEKKGYKIYALQSGKHKYAHKYFQFDGPETFVSLVKQAELVISNSFHAAVFSVLYERRFIIVNRTEEINTRMRDLLDDLKLNDRLINDNYVLDPLLKRIEYTESKNILNEKISFSKKYLQDVLSIKK